MSNISSKPKNMVSIQFQVVILILADILVAMLMALDAGEDADGPFLRG